MSSVRLRVATKKSWCLRVFWLPLFALVFSMLAGDFFHAPSCSKHNERKWTVQHDKETVGTISHHAIGAEVGCAACAFQSVAMVIVTANPQIETFLLPDCPRTFSSSAKGTCLARLPIARGPPFRNSIASPNSP